MIKLYADDDEERWDDFDLPEPSKKQLADTLVGAISGVKEIYIPPGSPPGTADCMKRFYETCGYKRVIVQDDSL